MKKQVALFGLLAVGFNVAAARAGTWVEIEQTTADYVARSENVFNSNESSYAYGNHAGAWTEDGAAGPGNPKAHDVEAWVTSKHRWYWDTQDPINEPAPVKTVTHRFGYSGHLSATENVGGSSLAKATFKFDLSNTPLVLGPAINTTFDIEYTTFDGKTEDLTPVAVQEGDDEQKVITSWTNANVRSQMQAAGSDYIPGVGIGSAQAESGTNMVTILRPTL